MIETYWLLVFDSKKPLVLYGLEIFMRKLLIFIFLIILASVLYNLDAIYGSWKFSRLCKGEGGPRFYSKVERNVGWLVVDVGDTTLYSYTGPFSFNDVAFVRWIRGNGISFDVYADTNGFVVGSSPDYRLVPADLSIKPKYELRIRSSPTPDDKRIHRTRIEIIDIEAMKLAASFTEFDYHWTTSDRVILAAPTGVSCNFETGSYQNFKKLIFSKKAN